MGGSSLTSSRRLPTHPIPRIKDPEPVEKDAALPHEQGIASVQASNFIRPIDAQPVLGNEVKCDGLSFGPTTELTRSGNGALTEAPITLVASLTFLSPVNSKLDTVNVTLVYDVYFVSYYLSFPNVSKPLSSSTSSPRISDDNKEIESSAAKSKSHSSNPSSKAPRDSKYQFRAPSTSTPNFPTSEKELPVPSAHHLRIDYRFITVPVANLLSMPLDDRPEALSSPAERKLSTTPTASNDEDVVILDCRGTEDLELLARAWCAQVGKSALIERVDEPVWLAVYEKPRRWESSLLLEYRFLLSKLGRLASR